jgi:prevent-host-death family protein
MILKNISEAKAQLSALLEAVQKGEEVLICKAGKPVAKLSAYSGAKEPRKLGMMEGQIVMTPDFDDPLPDEILEAFGVIETAGVNVD